MQSFLDHISNSSVFGGVLCYFNILQVYLHDTVQTLKEQDQLTSGFTEFQLSLFKSFSALLFVNVLLILAAWIHYGRDIYQRFIKLESTKEIEELKASVSKLKLPKEYSPRI